MANHTTNETNEVTETKFELSPFWAWMARWGVRVGKYILIVPILMGIGYGICARGLDFFTFVTTAFWAAMVIATVISILAPRWQKWEKSHVKVEKVEEASATKTAQPTSPDDVATKLLPTENDDSSNNPAYQLGYQDFLAGKDSQHAVLPSRALQKAYTHGYSMAMIEQGLAKTKEGETHE